MRLLVIRFSRHIFLKFQHLLKFKIQSIWKKSLTQDLMCRQDFLFEKTFIIFQTFWIIGVSGVSDWISQTRSAFEPFIHPNVYPINSLLFFIAYCASQILLSHQFFWLYFKRMQHHRLIHKINNLMFSNRSKIIFYQIPKKQDYLWSCFLGEVSFSSPKSLKRFMAYTLNTPVTLYDRKERELLVYGCFTHILFWLLN